jgi:TetR/AcrR family transcriptional regulator, cholesterol catabolism regulator
MAEKNTKQKMLDLARKLFWEKGYNATGMRDIANAYGCKPANIYNFFSQKEDILYEVLLEEMEQIITPIIPLEKDEQTNPIDQLRTVIESHLRITLSYRRSAKLLFDVGLDQLSHKRRKHIVAMRDRYDQIIRNIIQRGMDLHLFPETNKKLAGFMIASMITRSRLWYHPSQGVSISDLTDFIVNFSLNGLTGNQSLSSQPAH